MSEILSSAFWLVVALGVLITFHEFGHYWVARRCGVKVLRFSVGFGRALWSRTDRDGIEWRIGLIPLGGYVSMLDEREGEVADMVAYGRHQLGRVDILINNAGIQHVEAVEKFPSDKWEQIIAINLSSAFYATRAAIPIMKAQGRGRIINVASAHGLVASPFKSAYVAAKHGVIGFTKTVALEVAQDNITCNAICPGFVETPIVEKQIADQARTRGMSKEAVLKDVILGSQPTKRFVTTDELTGMMLYLVSDLGASANGASFSIDGGWTAQ